MQLVSVAYTEYIVWHGSFQHVIITLKDGEYHNQSA